MLDIQDITRCRGNQGFFIKHSSSGFCLQSASQYREKGSSTYGPLYVVHFYNTCLHPDAQFRFFEPFSILHNIGKNGTFLARDISGRGYNNRFHIYHSPIPPAKDVYIYTKRFTLKQTEKGALKLDNGLCPTPVKPGTNPGRPFIPKNGDEVYQTTSCDKEDQKFIFGSVTCDGNVITNVSCRQDQVMVIKNAVYGGRSDMKTCGFKEDTDCTVSVTCVVKRLCDGKQNCSINVDQALFNIDPCPGKSKYLYLEFICADSKPIKQLHVSDVKFSLSLLPNEGYLEVTIDNKKNKVCDTSADNKVKEVICRQFGYQGVKNGLSSTLPNIDNSKSFSGGISCSGEEQMLSHCCVTKPTFLGPDCLKSACVSCIICSQPLLEDNAKFPDAIFTASNSIDNHTPEKARLFSRSSWCASSNVENHLDIDFGVVYVISGVTIFGDAVSENWVTSYKLSYTRDGKNWIDVIAGENKEIIGNKNAYNDASTKKLNDARARILRFIPISSHGKRCMRVEICGHKLLPGQVKQLTLVKITSSSVTFSWDPPIPHRFEKDISYYHIKIKKRISRFLVLNMNHTNQINEKEVQGLLPYTEYEISIAAGNVYGIGEEKTLTFMSGEAGYSCSKTPLYIVIAISWVIIAVLIAVVVYLTACRPRFHSPTTEDTVITNTENATFSGDTYEEVKIPPSSSEGQNYENIDNRNSSQYDELQHDRKDEDEHNYQSLQKMT